MISHNLPATKSQIEGRLTGLAGVFVILYAVTWMVSPAVRLRTWEADFTWSHWPAVLLWLLLFGAAHLLADRWLPERDPYLLPAAGLLAGWGLLTIWRLLPAFGLRQSIWLLVVMALFLVGLRLPNILPFLRRYKYLWLTGGLLLTALTLLLGTNPSGGASPRLWLGCCGIYLQPSEPLKLLLIAYLAAYLAGGREGYAPLLLTSSSLLPLIAPTLIMTGLALLLLVVQRDLGTASIFLFLYAAIIYVTTGRKRILLISGIGILLAGAAGYLLFDVVRIRIEAWLNPWLDPSGRSYQIVQSLLAIANGGVIGRGPGLGSPFVVPVSHSDFIFASISEEMGLLGVVALLALLGLLAERGFSIALHAPDNYRRYLAAGLTAYLVGQSILIIGGNLRLLPLTGVTLPFVSYGGSSLITSFFSLLILLHISSQPDAHPAALLQPRPYLQLGGLLMAGLAAAALVTGWWAVYRAPALLTRTDNPRRAIEEQSVKRGAILDRRNEPLALSEGEIGSLQRVNRYPDLSPVLGYTSPIYGQAGIEALMDPYLRGTQGNPSSLVWQDHLLYGQPPPGLDVRLSIDLVLQQVADLALDGRSGAVVLLNPDNGEILALASHPTFDSNRLEESWDELVRDSRAPLLNRAAQGLYQPGAILGPLLLAAANDQGQLPRLPVDLTFSLGGITLSCATDTPAETLPEAVAAGCPAAVAALGRSLGAADEYRLFSELGLYSPPKIRLDTASSPSPAGISDPAVAALGEASADGDNPLRVSPLQVALASAMLSGEGKHPAASLVTAINTPAAGWVILPPLGKPSQVISSEAASQTASTLTREDSLYWESRAVAPNGPDEIVTWYIGGTVPAWQGSPLVVAVLLEEDNPEMVAQIGRAVLDAGIGR